MSLFKMFHGKKVRPNFSNFYINSDIKHSIRELHFECHLNFSEIRGLRQKKITFIVTVNIAYFLFGYRSVPDNYVVKSCHRKSST